MNEHRPDEKGIATTGPSDSLTSLWNEHRPDEKGIATFVKKCHHENKMRTNTDLMKKGLRHHHKFLIRILTRNEHRPDEKGIATLCPW